MSFCSPILQDCAFYSQAEQAAYRQKVAGLVKLSSHEYEKKKGRLLYSLGLYGRSASMYKRILDNGEGRSLSHELRERSGTTWEPAMGSCSLSRRPWMPMSAPGMKSQRPRI